MPTYTFKRTVDGNLVTKRLSFSDYDAVMSGEKTIVDGDGASLEIVFNPGTVGFVMKDGVSGGWATKVNKERRYRAARSSEMRRREKDHVFKPKLVPNYNGQEAHSWSDVRDHVRTAVSKEAASTYDRLVSEERKGS